MKFHINEERSAIEMKTLRSFLQSGCYSDNYFKIKDKVDFRGCPLQRRKKLELLPWNLAVVAKTGNLIYGHYNSVTFSSNY